MDFENLFSNRNRSSACIQADERKNIVLSHNATDANLQGFPHLKEVGKPLVATSFHVETLPNDNFPDSIQKHIYSKTDSISSNRKNTADNALNNQKTPVEIEALYNEYFNCSLSSVKKGQEDIWSNIGCNVDTKSKKRDDISSINSFADDLAETGMFQVISKELYYYNDRYWELLGVDEFMKVVKSKLNRCVTVFLNKNDYKELFSQLITNDALYQEYRIPSDFLYINFLNGVYDILNDCMLPHSSDYPFFYCLAVGFNPSENRSNFFEDYLMHYTNGNPKMRQLLLETIGYILSDLRLGKAFFVLLGNSNSGKSTFGTLIRKLIGEKNFEAIIFHKLGGRFGPASLRGKKLAMDLDVSTENFNRNLISNVNKLTGLDPFSSEDKYEKAKTFDNTCKIILAANTLPSMSNTKHEEAFLNRMVIIPFGNTLSDKEKDIGIIDKLLSEKDYIIELSMQALRILIDNNFNFTQTDESVMIKQQLFQKRLNKEDIIMDFITECCYIDKAARCFNDEIYPVYISYLSSHGLDAYVVNEAYFGKLISNLCDYVERFSTGIKRGYKGIGLNSYAYTLTD